MGGDQRDLLTDARIAGLKAAGVTGVAVSVDSLETPAARRSPWRRLVRGHHRRPGAPPDPPARLHHPDHGQQGTAGTAGCRLGGRAGRGGVQRLLPRPHRPCHPAPISIPRVRGGAGRAGRAPPSYLGRMMVRAKCAPHFMPPPRSAPTRPPNYQTRCPLRLSIAASARRQAHPVSYLPVERAISGGSPSRGVVGLPRVAGPPRRRPRRQVRALRVPAPLRRLPRPGLRARRGLPRGGSLLRVRAGRRRRAHPGRPSGDLRRARRAHASLDPRRRSAAPADPLVRRGRGCGDAGGPCRAPGRRNHSGAAEGVRERIRWTSRSADRSSSMTTSRSRSGRRRNASATAASRVARNGDADRLDPGNAMGTRGAVVTDPAVTPRRYALNALGLAALGSSARAPRHRQEADKAPDFAPPLIGSRTGDSACPLHLNFAAFHLGVPMFAVSSRAGMADGPGALRLVAHESSANIAGLLQHGAVRGHRLFLLIGY